MSAKLKVPAWIGLGILVLFYLIPWTGGFLPAVFHPGIFHLLMLNPVAVFAGILLFYKKTEFSIVWLAAACIVSGLLFVPSSFLFYNSSAAIYGGYYSMCGLFALVIGKLSDERREKKERSLTDEGENKKGGDPDQTDAE